VEKQAVAFLATLHRENGVTFMKIKYAIASLAAATMLSGAAVAFEGPRDDRKAERKAQREARQNSASTSTVGAAVTTRRGGAAAIDTRGTASGTGAVRSSSEGEVYSSTTRDGSDADAYGRSEAEAQERRRNRPN
jgi:hypothetical protein